MFNLEHVLQVKEKYKPENIGWICSCWDLLHPGHVKALEYAKQNCLFLVVGLQSNPRNDRPEKNEPVLSLEERRILISAIKYVDEVVEYDNEKDHLEILKVLTPSVRILGDDYIGKKSTGEELNIKTLYNARNPQWSTSLLRGKIQISELCSQMKNLVI